MAAPSELVELYGQRWEQELYFRQLKLQLRRTALLQSHTVTTAAQEIALLILASALVAQERVHAAAKGSSAVHKFFCCLPRKSSDIGHWAGHGPRLTAAHFVRSSRP